MSEYQEALKDMMTMLAAQHRAVFVGQSVGDGGTQMAASLAHLPALQRIEFPVAEATQLGVCIGMAMRGDLPICVYPRWNFLLEATGMLVSHLDKIYQYSRGGYRPKVIIRTAVGGAHQLNPGIQHLGDYSESFSRILGVVRVRKLKSAVGVREEYAEALAYAHSTILVEMAELY